MEAIVLAAGKGTRMRSDCPKVLHEVLGRPLLDYVLSGLAELGVRKPKVVVGYGADQVRSFIKKRRGDLRIAPAVIYQPRQLGTGHAIMMAKRHLQDSKTDVLVWPGDMPLLKRSTLKQFIHEHRDSGSEASALSALRVDPAGYGRILRAGGRFYAIREELDASWTERGIQEVNTGLYLFKASRLFEALRQIRPDNEKKEFYLTDVIEVLADKNCRMEAFPLASEGECQGINSRGDLARVIEIMKNREIQYHTERGVTFTAPEQTFVAPNVKIGRDTVIYPWCYVESGVKIGRGCHIGPFAKIRKGSVIGDHAVIGSFVEVTRSRIGKKVLAKHLAYLGDAVIGDETNVGAGTITANFDGKRKNPTRIGKKVLIGSNTVFVAPVTVGDLARTGAGAVVTRGSEIKKGEVVAGVPARPLRPKRKGN
jgi:bifunctional UDP-N-acetylglucosamine pyrophosphorylase/glucosamine-1-phosphate N-acetyltransferase